MIMIAKVPIAILEFMTFPSVEGSWKSTLNTLDLREKITLEIHF